MEPRMRTLGMALLVAVTVVGCAEAELAQSQGDIYQRDQVPADVLPSRVASAADARDWDEESSRLLATHDGHKFFLVRSAAQGNCLVTVDQNTPQSWVAACSPSNKIGMSGPAGVRAELDLDGFDEDVAPLEGWSRPVPELQVLVPRSVDRP
ncbi:UNVERIFIED_CONTAM: hypothetical protein RF653_05225 [Kocuria sp. CPCC 205316]|uniref:hypothetical protein n=1 Tax=Kocuria TaxID=57493 RepID=UPI0036DD519B